MTYEHEKFLVRRNNEVQNNPDITIFDLDILDNDDPSLDDEALWKSRGDEILELLESMLRHPQRMLLKPWIDEVAYHIGRHGGRCDDRKRIDRAARLLRQYPVP